MHRWYLVVDARRKRLYETDPWLEIIHERMVGTVAGHFENRNCPDKTAGQIVSGDSRTVWDGSTLDDTLCEVKKRDSSAFLLGDTQEHRR